MNYEVLITGPSHPEKNMEDDSRLLESLTARPRGILHFYGWEGLCATYGYFINPDQFLNRKNINNEQILLARRPTGGGIIFHHCDLAFSVLIPSSHPGYSLNTLDNYAFVNGAVVEAIKKFNRSFSLDLLPTEPVPLDESCIHFCMAKPTKYDIILEGRKVGGGAQRRTKHGFLHQGSLALALPGEEFLDKILLPGTCVPTAMRQNSCSLMAPGHSRRAWQEAHQEIQFLLIKSFQQLF